ncbi:MAG: B12-binding domain-containing radical SAM protein [Magnetococcales bacterium]|nr:B12-binding domain-containing radical SAM protein [Magnetococcales bacterium]
MNVVLYYPTMGMSGSLITHLPLSLLYAGIDTIQAGIEVRVVDARLDPENCQKSLANKIDKNTIMVGVSVMTGAPIINALEISHFVKKSFPHLKIVWGGPHATFNGLEILEEPIIDYVVSGYGSEPLAALACYLRGDEDAKALSEISGLNYRNGDKAVAVPPVNAFEMVDYKKIPYHLIKDDLHHYGQLDSGDVIFSLYSAMGCPYKCTFCSAPAQYSGIRRKFEILPYSEVVDHIEYVKKEYGATYIYFIDDDSFVRISHVESIIDEIIKRDIDIGLGFRGARVNEIKKMSDQFLKKLAQAGTDILHIGAESGSQKILDLIKKNCTVADIIEVNKKLAKHPQIKTGYNWLAGVPGETLEDLRQTRELIATLVSDNPNTVLFPPNLFRPLPHTELYYLAVEQGYKAPEKIKDWADLENSLESTSGDELPWCSKEHINQVYMMQICSYFIDGKIFKVKTGNNIKFMIIRFLTRIYTPFAKLRMKYGYSGLLIEKHLFKIASRFMGS